MPRASMLRVEHPELLICTISRACPGHPCLHLTNDYMDVGNAHTPAWVGWLGSLVLGSFGNIDQRILGRSIAAEIAAHSREAGEVTRENAAMNKLASQFNSVP